MGPQEPDLSKHSQRNLHMGIQWLYAFLPYSYSTKEAYFLSFPEYIWK